jgi:hypothetical protein
VSSRLRNHIRSNVVGYIALFLVLTGGTASALNGSNTVFSDDIVNKQVKTEDLATGAVTGSRLAPNSVGSGRVVDDSLTGADVSNLTGADVTDGTLTGNDVQDGSIFGSSIANGGVGAADIGAGAVNARHFGTIERRANSVMIPGGAGENGAYITGEQTVNCQPGEMALSGEAFWVGGDDEELFISEFIFGHNGADVPVSLRVTGGNDSGATRQMNIAVYCLAP